MDASWNEVPAIKKFYQFFWVISGKGSVFQENRWRTARSHHVFIYRPGDLHQLRAENETWEYRWFTVHEGLTDALVKSFGVVPSFPRNVGLCPHELFLKLEAQIQNHRANAELEATATAFELITRALSTQRSIPTDQNTLVSKVVHALESLSADPLFSIEGLADSLKIHRSSLTRQFSAQTGLSPVEYLLNIRIQRAASLLRETNESIAEIARKSGFTDPNYFARIFRKRTELSPKGFRNYS